MAISMSYYENLAVSISTAETFLNLFYLFIGLFIKCFMVQGSTKGLKVTSTNSLHK